MIDPQRAGMAHVGGDEIAEAGVRRTRRAPRESAAAGSSSGRRWRTDRAARRSTTPRANAAGIRPALRRRPARRRRRDRERTRARGRSRARRRRPRRAGDRRAIAGRARSGSRRACRAAKSAMPGRVGPAQRRAASACQGTRGCAAAIASNSAKRRSAAPPAATKRSNSATSGSPSARCSKRAKHASSTRPLHLPDGGVVDVGARRERRDARAVAREQRARLVARPRDRARARRRCRSDRESGGRTGW